MPLGSDDPAIEARRRAAHLTRVRLLRRGLPIAAGVLTLVCVAQVGMAGVSAVARTEPPTAVDTMLKPRFSGRGPDGGSFVITGREGHRLEAASGQIEIAEPVLALKTANDGTRRMTAKSGVFDEAAHALTLTGEVKLDNGSGARFTAQQARIDTRTGAVSGQKGLRMESSSGASVQGGSYSTDETGDRVIVKGGVRGRLIPKN